MKTKLLASIILFVTSIFTYGIDLSDNCPESMGNYTANESNFLDIIIDKTHAYVYLSCSNCNEGFPYSVYASLMPKDESKILEWFISLFPQESIAEHSYENDTHIVKFPNGTSLELNNLEHIKLNDDGGFVANFSNGTVISYGLDEEDLTLDDVIKMTKILVFTAYYEISDYLKTSQDGKIVNDLPDPSNVKVQKRFCLTSEQAKQVFDLINKSFMDSSQGKIIYDTLKYSCIDFAKKIYEAAGLDKTNGEFLSQFDISQNCYEDDDCTILNYYRGHKETLSNKLSWIWELLNEDDNEN